MAARSDEIQNGEAGETVPSDATPAVDVKTIMERIRAQAKRELAATPRRLPKWTPPAAQLADPGIVRLIELEELSYVNLHWNTWLKEAQFTSHRRLLGPLVQRLKKAARRYLCEVLLADYFAEEREYQLNLIRYLNAIAHYVDRRDGDLFWQLVEKLDSDIGAANDRVDRLYDDSTADTAALKVSYQAKLAELDDVQAKLRQELCRLQEGLREHQELIARLISSRQAANAPGITAKEALQDNLPLAAVSDVVLLPAQASGRGLRPIAIPDYLPPDWQEILRQINENLVTLNELLFSGRPFVKRES